MNKIAKFTVAGTSILDGAMKIRFSNDLAARQASLTQYGDTDITLVELGSEMTKLDAVVALQALEPTDDFEGFVSPAAQAAFVAFIAKSTPKPAGVRGRPVTLPTLADVPTRDNGKFISMEERQKILAIMIADKEAASEKARTARVARAAKKTEAAAQLAAAAVVADQLLVAEALGVDIEYEVAVADAIADQVLVDELVAAAAIAADEAQFQADEQSVADAAEAEA
jgi:hypothetical protein